MSFRYLGSTPGYLGKNKKGKDANIEDDLEEIYFVTSLHETEDGWDRTRTWGWFRTYKEASKSVKMNAGDMAECCYYSHTVIEKMPCGIPSMAGEFQRWFKWVVDPKDKDRFRGKWMRCSKPVWSEGIIGFSIG